MTNEIVGAAFSLDTTVLNALAGGIEEDADAVVLKVAYDIELVAQESFTGQKSGRFYGAHQASAPGEAPAVDTGDLRNSIGVSQRQKCEAFVTASAEHAPYLEFGTRFMSSRPFLSVAVNSQRQAFDDAVGMLFNVE